MMLIGSHFNRKPLASSGPQLIHASPVRIYTSHQDKSNSPPQSLTTLPTWVTQALCDLEQGEQELQRLREHQTAEVDKVNEGLDSAVLGVQREERRLLERVEQEHRDAQRRLEQLKKENSAAARVGQSLVDRQLRKITQLREQIHRWGTCANGPNKSQLLRGVKELTQPWEISLSLKKVAFQPAARHRAAGFGEIDVQEHSLSFPVGACGPQGHKCAIHSGDMPSEKFMAVSEQLKSSCNGGASEAGTGDFTKASRGNMRIVRKIRLSGTDEDKLGEEVKFSSSKPPVRPRKQETSESSQDEDLDSFGSDARGDDLFLAISSQGESGEGRGQNGQSDMQGPRKSRTLVLVSSHEPSCPPEGSTLEHKSWYERSEDYDRNQGDKLYDIGKETSQYCCETITSPKIRPNSPLSGRPRIRHSRSLEKHPLKIRSPSPTDSVDSSNTFTIRSAAQSSSFKEDDHRSMSTADLSGRNDLLINGAKGEHQATKRGSRIRMSSAPSNLEPRFKVSDGGPNPSCQESRENQPPLKMISEGSSRVSRSMSMSAIEGRNMRLPKFQQHEERGKKEQADPVNIQEHRGILKVGHLVRKFGKQGSGRSDFTLPSGVHATAQGQLFVVDCGNVRVQVTDLQQNVVQQVTPASSEGSARHCRNFFDVAVNSKGLIALTCAAERALLVFSRHGRHLQTFGSSPVTGTQELEAPRGVTITKLDEFLVADIRRGTLTALKLDAKTGAKVERTVVTGFQRPYLVAACLTSGLMVVSERGIEAGRPPCIRVLEPGWNTIRILGVCSGMGPVLSCPWGICIDKDGDVLVADWGKQHRVVLYPAVGVGRSIVTQGLSSPRGLALLPEGHLVVSDSMNHCIKIYRYK